jgi:hypothetical protein
LFFFYFQAFFQIHFQKNLIFFEFWFKPLSTRILCSSMYA